MEEITQLSQLDLSKQYTYADYLTWQLKERVELIKGFIHRMSPAPRTLHQEVSGIIHGNLFAYLRKKSCKVYAAPFDVRFIDDDGVIRDTVQPDLSVICDLGKLDHLGCLGAPDLVVEILSPSSAQRDLKYKYDLYRLNCVKEYWVVHPEEKTLLIYTLGIDGEYIPSRLFTRGDVVQSNVLKGFTLDLNDVFEPFDWTKVEEQEALYHRI